MKLRTSHYFSVTVFGTLVIAAVVKALADKYAPALTPAGIVSKIPSGAPSTTAK